LTNNSINKHSDNYNDAEDLFWTMGQLADHCHEEFGYDYYNEVMKPRMKEIAVHSLKSCQEHIQNRKNSSEIYGYDFCIDEAYNIWLIEINSSPAFDFSSVIVFGVNCCVGCHRATGQAGE
jgi:tubulin monoglycylase TTLL3/8